MSRTDDLAELGLSPGASAEEIRRAFRRAQLEWHPDKAPEGREGEFRERWDRVCAAFARLDRSMADVLKSLVDVGAEASDLAAKARAGAFSERDAETLGRLSAQGADGLVTLGGRIAKSFGEWMARRAHKKEKAPQ